MDKNSKEVKKVVDKKEYTCKAVFNLGSNKNGTPKKTYKLGDKILLTDKQAVIMKNKNKI